MVLAVLFLFLGLHVQDLDHQLRPYLVLFGAVRVEVLWVHRLSLEPVEPLLPLSLLFSESIVGIIGLQALVFIFSAFLPERAHPMIGSATSTNITSYIQVRSMVSTERIMDLCCRLGVSIQGLLRALYILLNWWIGPLTFQGTVATLALLLNLVNDVFLLLLDFGADRLLEEGSDPFGARPVVNLAFLRFAGLGEDLRARCRPRLSTVAFG